MVITKTCFLFPRASFSSELGSFALATFASKAAAFFSTLAATVLAVMTASSGLALGFVEIILYFCQDLLVIRCIHFRIERKGPAEVAAHVEQHFYAEVETFADALRWATEAGFAGIRVGQRELSPHYNPSSGFLRLCDGECGACVARI